MMASVDIPASPNTREEAYLAAIAGQTVEVPAVPITREEAYLDAILKNGSGGGGGGTTDYTQLENKPQINDVTLTGNKSLSDLGVASASAVSGKENLKLATEGSTSEGEIRFGVDGQGNYGYIKAGADSVTPFKNPTGNKAIPQITQNGTVTDIDVADYATASLDIAVPAPTHTGTYTPAANTAANDMGETHSYRYVDTSGMIKPSGTRNISITSNGETTTNIKSYENVKITANVVSDYEKKIRKKWTGLTDLGGSAVWTDGINIYYSSGNDQYVLDRIVTGNLYQKNLT